jgi:hypothetical protein
MAFDVEGAKKAGYSDAEIAAHLAQQSNFDVTGAKKAGYSDADIVKHLSTSEAAPTPTAGAGNKPVMRAPSSAVPERMPAGSDVEQYLGVANRALLPYAATAAGGFAVGGPAGAVLAPTALGISNLATAGYNAVTGSNVPTATETMQNFASKYGIGREPETPTQKVFSSALEAGAGGLTQAGAANALAQTVQNPTTRGVFNVLAQQPGIQAASGAGAAALPTAAREYLDVTDPYATAGLTLAGGALGAKGGAGLVNKAENTAAAVGRAIEGTNITPEALKARAVASFRAADESGARYSPNATAEFVDTLKTDLKSKNYSPTGNNMGDINTIISRLEDASANPATISELHSIRSDLSRIRGTATTPNERRLASIITDKLDSFITNPKNAAGATSAEAATARMPGQPENWPVPLSEGGMPSARPSAASTPIGAAAEANVEKGAEALKSGIKDYAKYAKSDVIEQLLNRAAVNSSANKNTDLADAIKTQFATLERNPTRMARFTEAEQKMISDITSGKTSGAIINAVSKLAPNTSLLGLLKSGLAAGGGGLAGGPVGAAIGGGLLAAGGTANALRNMYAKGAVNDLAGAIRRGDARLPVQPNAAAMVSPTWQNFLLQQNAAGQ